MDDIIETGDYVLAKYGLLWYSARVIRQQRTPDGVQYAVRCDTQWLPLRKASQLRVLS